jgi:Ni/Co efflux regulator RcnB
MFKRLVCAVAALSMLGGGAALADPGHGHGHGHGHGRGGSHGHGAYGHSRHYAHASRHGHAYAHSYAYRHGPSYRHGPVYAYDDGPRWRAAYHPHRHHYWARGQYLPRYYLAEPYYVDYRVYDLRPPPYGYRWVRVDDRFLLVAVASGLIASMILSD